MNNVEVIKVFNNPSRLKRVAGYARVSTADEHQDSSYTLQTEELEQEIKSNPRYEFIGIFKDKKSGRNTKHRIEFNAMIELALLGEIDIIITKSITRFARNILDTISIVRNLKNHNVEVIFQKENISSLDPSIEFVLSVLAMHAEEESKNLSDNTKWSIRKKVINKRNLTSHLYGYDIKGEDWTVIDSEAKVVRMIFDMYINNKSYISIVEKLHKMKIKTSTGKDRWHTGTIEQMVQNEKYAGHMALGKTYLLNGNQLRTRRQNYNQEHFVYNHHEPIISQEIFDQAMNLRKSRSRNTINTYVPEVERLTPYAYFVYSEENHKHLKYVVERPKGKYEIPTLYCYNKQRKNRVSITVKNLTILLMDVISHMKFYMNDLSSNITSYINESVTVCDADLENANEKIDLLNFKTKLLSAKNNLPSYFKFIRNINDSLDIQEIKRVFAAITIHSISNFSIKLNLLDNGEYNHKLIESVLPLKLGYKNVDVTYSVYL